MASYLDRGEPCPYCGHEASQAAQGATCAVCGMAISRDHWPHILRFDPEAPAVHFCSLACMDNYDSLQETLNDG